MKDANRYLQSYHPNTQLIKYQKRDGSGYAFVNAPKNIPYCKYLFSSVQKAMNFFLYHENKKPSALL